MIYLLDCQTGLSKGITVHSQGLFSPVCSLMVINLCSCTVTPVSCQRFKTLLPIWSKKTYEWKLKKVWVYIYMSLDTQGQRDNPLLRIYIMVNCICCWLLGSIHFSLIFKLSLYQSLKNQLPVPFGPLNSILKQSFPHNQSASISRHQEHSILSFLMSDNWDGHADTGRQEGLVLPGFLLYWDHTNMSISAL